MLTRRFQVTHIRWEMVTNWIFVLDGTVCRFRALFNVPVRAYLALTPLNKAEAKSCIAAACARFSMFSEAKMVVEKLQFLPSFCMRLNFRHCNFREAGDQSWISRQRRNTRSAGFSNIVKLHMKILMDIILASLKLRNSYFYVFFRKWSCLKIPFSRLHFVMKGEVIQCRLLCPKAHFPLAQSNLPLSNSLDVWLHNVAKSTHNKGRKMSGFYVIMGKKSRKSNGSLSCVVVKWTGAVSRLLQIAGKMWRKTLFVHQKKAFSDMLHHIDSDSETSKCRECKAVLAWKNNLNEISWKHKA